MVMFPYFAAQGLHGLHGFAAQGLHDLAAQGLHDFAAQGLQAPQVFELTAQGLQALQAAYPGCAAPPIPIAAAIAMGMTVLPRRRVR